MVKIGFSEHCRINRISKPWLRFPFLGQGGPSDGYSLAAHGALVLVVLEATLSKSMSVLRKKEAGLVNSELLYVVREGEKLARGADHHDRAHQNDLRTENKHTTSDF